MRYTFRGKLFVLFYFDPPYGTSNQAFVLTPDSRLLYLGLIVGTLISEIFCSGRLSDWMVVKLAKSNNNQKTPEMRLWLAYPAAVLTAVGLIVWGVSVDQGYHWMVGQVAFALCKFICPPGFQ
jgi:hypothetical protein